MTSSGLDAAHECVPVVVISTNSLGRLYFSRWSEFSAVGKTGLALLVSPVCESLFSYRRVFFVFSTLLREASDEEISTARQQQFFFFFFFKYFIVVF